MAILACHQQERVPPSYYSCRNNSLSLVFLVIWCVVSSGWFSHAGIVDWFVIIWAIGFSIILVVAASQRVWMQSCLPLLKGCILRGITVLEASFVICESNFKFVVDMIFLGVSFYHIYAPLVKELCVCLLCSGIFEFSMF